MLLEELRARRGRNDLLGTERDGRLRRRGSVRGYRVDVFDEDAPGGGRWFSLHRPVGHASSSPTARPRCSILEVTDEGYLKATAASSESKEHPTPSDDLYLHEAICGWEGWSLAAPRPGKRIVEPGEGDDGGSIVAHHDPEAGNPFPSVTEVAAPKHAARLRVGHTYRMRVRTVDLAGNSVPFSEQELEPASPS